ncbi:FAD-binding domain-containing protein [Xylariaceae sp. FL1272]|nr:FAD-binding domain-containing protein [Xylariaceae sp. FL1272]
MVSFNLCVVLSWLVGFQALVAGLPSHRSAPYYFKRHVETPRDINPLNVQTQLGPLLSSGAIIFGPSSPLYANATERYDRYVKPDIQVVVQPATEDDVAKIVKFCNANGIEFLARNRGHGSTSTLTAFSGLEIDLKLLQNVDINEKTQTAVLQGGTYAGPLIGKLWDRGYVTGHGRLEGEYGLIADGILQYNVVLADGSHVKVDSTHHQDLLWGLKGAGHNFGIVTSYEVKIHPVAYKTWHYHNYTWTGDKLEKVFTEMNKVHTADHGTTPVKLSYAGGTFLMDPSISTTDPVLAFTFAYHGPADEAEALLAPFNAIPSVHEEVGDVSYVDLANIQGTNEGSAGCNGGPLVTGSNFLVDYNITTERQIYNQFKQNVAKYPGIGNGVAIVHEGYSDKAVQAIPADSTAYPHRHLNHLVVFLGAVLDDKLEQAIRQWAKQVHDLWTSGKANRKPEIYANYATGESYESVNSIYGYEPWRLARLRGLKAKYDPKNRFRHYVPLE